MLKRFLLPFSLLPVVFCSPAMALSGGPFQNNEPTNGGAGTYQGVLSGENLIGVLAFGYSRTAQSSGRWAVFHEGFARFGDMQAVVDTASGTVAGVLGGDLITGTTDASGGFSAKVTSKAPIILFEGDGLFVSPASPQTFTTGSDTTTITTVTTVGDPGNAVQTGTTTTVTDTSSSATIDETPFTIRGSRSSTTAGTFTTIQ